jgi:hypothetical protein
VTLIISLVGFIVIFFDDLDLKYVCEDSNLEISRQQLMEHFYENISSYLYMHHLCFKHITSVCKMYKPINERLSHDFHCQIMGWEVCDAWKVINNTNANTYSIILNSNSCNFESNALQIKSSFIAWTLHTSFHLIVKGEDNDKCISTTKLENS